MKNTRRNKIIIAAIWLIVLASGTGLFVSAQTPTPQSNEIRELGIGVILEREINVTAIHKYKISVEKGGFIRIDLEGKGIYLILRLFEPNGKLVKEFNCLKQTSLSFEAIESGEYFLEVNFPRSQIGMGIYKIYCQRKNVINESDKKIIEAENYFQNGLKLIEYKNWDELKTEVKKQELRVAVNSFKEAAKIWRELNEFHYEGKALFSLFDAYGFLNIDKKQNEPIYTTETEFQERLSVLNKKWKEIETWADDDLNWGINSFKKGLDESPDTEKSKRYFMDSINSFQESLKLYRSIFDYDGEVIALNNIGLCWYLLREKQKAFDSYSYALKIELFDPEKKHEKLFANLGKFYADAGEKIKALEYYKKAIEIQSWDSDEEVGLLNNIGLLYSDLGMKADALKYYQESLLVILSSRFRIRENYDVVVKNPLLGYRMARNTDTSASNEPKLILVHPEISIEFSFQNGESTLLNNIGATYSDLGDKTKALEYFNKALELQEKSGCVKCQATTLNNIGLIYDFQNDQTKAMIFYSKALQIQKDIGDDTGQATTLTNIGSIHSKLGKKDEAITFFEQALILQRKNNDQQGEAITLNNIGKTYLLLGRISDSTGYLCESLKLAEKNKLKSTEARILHNLMLLWRINQNSQFAILYGKKSVNTYQELRQNIKTLSRTTQQTYLTKIEETYRILTDILIAEGRVAEAEQVLGMLKEEEFFEYLRRDDKAAKELKATIKLTPTEEEAFSRYEEIADEITRIGREFGELEKESKKFPVGKFPRQAELDKLDAQLADARKVFNKFLEELDARFRNKETKEKDSRVAQISGTKALLDSLNQPRTVIISTIAGEDRLNLIVTTSKINRAHTVDIKAADLNKLVVEFRDAVKNPLVDPRPLGKKLYDVLFPADLQKDLAGVDADTIVWSLDGTLRYAPISALWDGEKYLVERYSNAIITLASRDKIDKTFAARTNWTALGLGVSQKFETFAALKAVPEELCRVVNDEQKKAECLKLTGGKTGVFGGVNLSDGEFTFESLKLHLGRYPIVHIASHFSLNAGTENDSYLLLGGGKTSDERKLTISAVREKLDLKFNGTELLVLSACNTAMSSGANSSGAEIEGFGALAQEQGAKTVLASLWSVADDSTRDLMTEFYDQLKRNPKIGKAESLRKSQIALLNGKSKPGETPLWRGTAVFNLNETKQPAFKTDANAPFAHPFYWSPFILFGNWR